ncbi:MAG: TonB-dependent receptor [Bacteroidales bacterium]|nr:TonB-dependent receptor [Bacteroidales bacterium]
MENRECIISIKEHEYLPQEYFDRLKTVDFVGIPQDFMGEPKYLGIGKDFRASYYIGTCWLTEYLTITILPKIENIDFIKMFLAALEVDSEADYFAKCYKIDFDKPAIKTQKNLNVLSPLLILHFITLLEKIVKRGLKRGYIIKEENLKSKIKGRIVFTQHLQQNIFQKRDDRIYCRYQEYTFDIPENRLLKKALMFSEKVLERYESIKKQSNYQDIKKRFIKLKQHFALVSDDIQVSQIQNITANKLFVNYKSAVKVAKMILRRFDYSIQEAGKQEETTPPFWIDMARLFELYVLYLLGGRSGNIEFQFPGYSGSTDFLKIDEQIIIDTKYKLDYNYDSNDIRQLSGYARDRKILKKLGVTDEDNCEIQCLIIYPNKNGFPQLGDNLISESIPIQEFRNFYKISVKLPVIEQL